MKKLLDYIRDFLKGHFSWKLYVTLGIYISLIIAFDYGFRFQRKYIYALNGVEQWLAFFWYYAVCYLGAIAIIAFHRKKWTVFGKKAFWGLFLYFFIFLSLYRALGNIVDICHYIDSNGCLYSRKLFRYGSRILTIFLPALLAWRLFDRKNPSGFYGINTQKFDWSPYGWMLLIMIPIIGLASFLPSFQNYYPLYNRTGAGAFAQVLDVPEWMLASFYEAFYALGFINIELFFRGVLVWAMFRFLGKDSVLAMVVLYAVFHFGKPLGETISSVFGGFVLGAISVQTRSIWGGICIHVSIAWLMELFAYLQKVF